MGRVPCCEKMGLKKGPWSKEEDRILIDYINQHGHRNWRELPKLAGLLRCGKSCRLRWTNYLRPDIKRGNFSKEEEDTILELHRELGNKWSAIAAKLPGRTDNEIKNVWHTHLKKRLKQSISETKSREDETLVQVVTDKFDCQDLKSSSAVYVTEKEEEEQDINTTTQTSPPHPSSSITDTTLANSTRLIDEHPDLNQDFWPEVVSSQCQPDKINHHGIRDSDYSARGDAGTGIMLPLSPALDTTADQDCGFKYSSSTTQVETDFWCDLFTITDQEISELLEFSKYN